jgi:hypothetical protein
MPEVKNSTKRREQPQLLSLSLISNLKLNIKAASIPTKAILNCPMAMPG